MNSLLIPSPALPAEREHGWHWEDDCPVAELVRAYAELHRQAHGSTVADCRQQPCTQLIASLLHAPAGAGPVQGRQVADMEAHL